MKRLATLLLSLAPLAAAAYDANGVALGGSENEIRKKFPSARCQALEWKSQAADRRCDDARIAFAGGVQARITFYLNRNAVQAFDIRFDTKEIERVTGFLKKQYGAPAGESTDELTGGDGKATRRIYKARWEKGRDRVVLVSEKGKSRSSLLASRGDFDEEIYRVR
jgi:hypothetical protein